MRRRSAFRRGLARVILVAIPALCAAPVAALAQAPPVVSERPARAFTGTHVSADHWAARAARRAEALLLTDDYLPAQRHVPLELLERALREAAANAPDRAPALAGITAYWLDELHREMRGLDAAASGAHGHPYWIAATAGVGVEGRRGAAAPGLAQFDPDRTGALPLEDRLSGLASYETRAVWGRNVGLHVNTVIATHGSRVEALELTGGLGSFIASAGRLPIGYGHGVGGGVVLTGEVTFDGAQIGTRSPLTLPGPLAYLGPVTLHAAGARMTEERHPGDPYFWSASGQFQPHRRLTLGIHRAALFGGDPDGHPVTPRNILDMLIGRVAGVGFEDQVVSASARYHLPTERVVPLTAYLEWGAEDAAGAWWAVPGRVLGLEAPVLPSLPGVSAGVELSHFGGSCCGNPPWYRHWSFPGSWASGERTMGHPLGGDGRELLVHAGAEVPELRLRVLGRAFARERRDENLYTPGRAGRSAGGQLGATWRPLASRAELRLEGGLEHGGDWTELRGGLHARYHF